MTPNTHTHTHTSGRGLIRQPDIERARKTNPVLCESSRFARTKRPISWGKHGHADRLDDYKRNRDHPVPLPLTTCTLAGSHFPPLTKQKGYEQHRKCWRIRLNARTRVVNPSPQTIAPGTPLAPTCLMRHRTVLPRHRSARAPHERGGVAKHLPPTYGTSRLLRHAYVLYSTAYGVRSIYFSVSCKSLTSLSSANPMIATLASLMMVPTVQVPPSSLM